MMKSAALFAALASVLCAQSKIIGGPFVVNVTTRTATVVWVVQTDELSIRPANGGDARTSPSFRVENTTLTGLSPNTRYDYQIPGHNDVKGFFKTPPQSAGAFKFLVYGDTRTRHDVHGKVVEAMLKSGPADFAVQTGDLVENGSDNSLWPIFFGIEKDLLRQLSFFPVLGNHERNSHDFYDIFQAAAPYRSFNWGNVHFTLINSDIGNSGAGKAAQTAFWVEQTKWLEEDLAASQSSEFRILVAHHPPFSAVTKREGANPEMRALIPLLEKYHVSLGLFGHDHNYQRYLQNGIQYVITGGGGAPLYDVDKPDPQVQKAISTENFCTVEVDGKSLKLVAHALDGTTLDQFEIKH